MKPLQSTLAALTLLSLTSTGAWAVDAASVPSLKQTKAGLYLNAEEVPGFLTAKGGKALFIDVRTPAELIFVGSTPLMDANVPLEHGPTADTKKVALTFEPNPNFVAQVEDRLKAKSLTKADAVVLMCRSGSRSAAAANVLTATGFTQVYTVVDGFEGDMSRGDATAGRRNVNGWRNKGLPWGYALDTAKLTLGGATR